MDSMEEAAPLAPGPQPEARCRCFPPCPGHRLLRPVRGVLLLGLFVVSTMEMTVFFFLPLVVLQPLCPCLTLALFRAVVSIPPRISPFQCGGGVQTSQGNARWIRATHGMGSAPSF